MSGDYEREQEELERNIEWLQVEIDSFDKQSVNTDKFLELVNKYTDFTELTTPMLNEFVEKVIIHEADKSTGERIQKVDIYLNFIGIFNMPPPELTPEEIKEIEKLKHKRKIARRSYARRKQRQSA